MYVSVIIPLYNGSKNIQETVQSVLDQTYKDFELIIVDDVSTDDSAKIVGSFIDERIRYICHPKNRGANAARNTGIKSSKGEIIAFLDQDDKFHPNKLATHVSYHLKNPQIGLTYNARYELYYSTNFIREIVNPPQEVGLQDLLTGFPVVPSEIVLKKEWILRAGFWDEAGGRGAEYTFLGRLFLAGCRFARVNGIHNYRGHHSGRVIKNIKTKCDFEIRNQEIIFSDPRFPENLRSIRNTALSKSYLVWSYEALTQGENLVGVELFNKAVELCPELLSANRNELIQLILMYSITDKNIDHNPIIKKIVEKWSINLKERQVKNLINDGDQIKGLREIIWGRFDQGEKFIKEASKRKAFFSDTVSEYLMHQLVLYSVEFGSQKTRNLVQDIDDHFSKIRGYYGKRILLGKLLIQRSFYSYENREYSKIPKDIMFALFYNPKFIFNRGIISIFIKSIIYQT